MISILHGDALERLRELADASIDACVTDPPYGIRFMGKAWDGKDIEAQMAKRMSQKQSLQKNGRERSKPRNTRAESAGTYDVAPRGNLAFQRWTQEWATEMFRVLKPGAHLVSFASTRTYHRMASGIEDAGFEIRDQLAWVFGSGFPKSHNLEGEWEGWGTALKPAWDPIVLARKPLIGTVAVNVAAHGTGAIHIDACRVEGGAGGTRDGEDSAERIYADRGATNFSPTPGPRGGDSRGRWPANLLHDGSDEVVAMFPETKSGRLEPWHTDGVKTKNCFGEFKGRAIPPEGFGGDSGSAARFFYCAKASRSDRNDGCDALPARKAGMVSNTSGQHITRRNDGYVVPEVANHHPTVKPTELMRWLCRLVTPPGGKILDPFMGSGSTGRAATLEGFEFVGIDQDAEYCEIARARIAAAEKSRDEQAIKRTAQPELFSTEEAA